MTLNHATGEMDGEVTAGRMQGARLSELSTAELQGLVAEFEATGDEESLALLLAYLDRRGTARAASPPPPEQPKMTEAEVYRVLGLAPGASLEEIRAAYRRLMKRVHPDLGGSSALAALLNAAKEILDPS
jgi:DnaJ-domain-containing protein 1